jgi:hypothetical protein
MRSGCNGGGYRKENFRAFVHDGKRVYSDLRALYGPRMQPMDDMKPAAPVPSAEPAQSNSRQEVRCAVRFPLTLPVVLATGSGEVAALSRNVSASGVLFELDQQLPAGADIRFSLRMPGEVLGTLHDVLVHCLGRVVRCSLSQTQYLAAATIDEYQFAEQ